LIFSVLVGCGKRENPVRTVYPFSQPWKIKRTFPSLEGNIIRDSPERWAYIYLPPQYDWEKHFPHQPGFGFPVLYLLHDFWDDHSTFVDIYKVQQIADRLIAEGEIQPMIIVMPDGSNYFGGSFYTNSDLIGRYEDYIKELMDTIDVNFHTVVNRVEDEYVPDRRYRAISGHGMGGYGAFKMALDYDTTLFCSVSAMSPYLSFRSFLTREMIEEVFRENRISEDDFSLASYKTINPWTDSLHPEKSITQLIFAMSAAFSPHDPNDTDPDDPQFFEVFRELEKRYGVDLPFDSARTISPGSEIWNRWMLYHDIKTLFERKSLEDKRSFAELKIYFDCGDQDYLKLYEGAQAFHDDLARYGIENTYVEYPGYENFPAGHMNFIYDRLPEILKFHSRHFPPPRYFGYK
ncbi:MAG: alpha/beta hydrolase, partial [Candidatus Zixiibacteriota bacterium]